MWGATCTIFQDPSYALDVKPGSCPNPLNTRSNGVIPVALLGSEEWDVRDIDASSLRLNGVAPIKANFEDVAAPYDGSDDCGCTVEGPDGYEDLTLKFGLQDIYRTLGQVYRGDERTLVLTGSLLDGTRFEARDCVLIVGGTKVPQSTPPICGSYYSDDQPGGSFHPGRFSESWVGDGDPWQIGNTFNGGSWDGSSLNGEWALRCASLSHEPILEIDQRDHNGTGFVQYLLFYVDGEIWLSADGSWGWGTTVYTARCGFFHVRVLQHYVLGQILASHARLITTGYFEDWDRYFEIEMNYMEPVGNSNDDGSLPGGFPAFMDEDCSTGVWSRGEWGDLNEIRIRIFDDPLGTDPLTGDPIPHRTGG
jgi:hypothetical protein